ncbi:MAG: prepilin-type N-terminal cleavage/methylation domain-containing protein [Candidatus Jacksonbacteria bacterium]
MFVCLNVKMNKKMVKQEKKYKLKKSPSSNGFTLVELLVAMATFVVVVITIMDIFLMGLGGSRKIFGQQNIQESGRFIIESMSKEIRMSKINTAAGSSNVVNITNSKGQTLNYSFDNVNKIISRNGEALNADEVELTGNFYIQKDSPDSQPRVTVVMILKNKTNKAGEQSEIDLQTTISSRYYVQ